MYKKLFFLLFLFVSLTLSGEVTEEDDVVVLTDKNFDEFVGLHPNVLVEFYAPWCGHCKKLAPEYSRASKRLKAEDVPIFLAKVDSTVEKEVAQRFEIKGYPTLKFFQGGAPMEYTGGITEEEIINWLHKKTGPSSKKFTEQSALEKFVNDNEVVVIFFGDESSQEFHAYEAFTKTSDDYLFGHTSSVELKEHYKAQVNSVVLFKQFDEKRNDFTQSIEAEALKTWLGFNSLPTIIKFDQKAAQKIFGDNRPTLFLFHNSNDASNKAIKVLEETASQLKGKILLSTSQIVDGIGKRLGDYIGVTEDELPCVIINYLY